MTRYSRHAATNARRRSHGKPRQAAQGTEEAQAAAEAQAAGRGRPLSALSKPLAARAATRLDTARLTLTELTPEHAPFVLALLNDPAWLRNVGDRGIRTVDGARDYIVAGPITMYAREGFGLWKTALRASGEPIGLCGLIKRPTLDDVDLGFALLPAYRGQGYAQEAAQACVDHARQVAGLRRLVAIVSPANEDSIRLLDALGLRYERMVELTPGDPVRLHAMAL